MSAGTESRQRRDIAVGLLCREDGSVLIGQRRPDTDYEGWWEFPGGKFEAGESVQQALARELYEELGIRVHRSEPAITLDWRYPKRDVRLHTQRVTAWSGRPKPMEGQAIRWVSAATLDQVKLLPANKPIVDALRLPERYLISRDPSGFPSEQAYLQSLESVLSQGIDLLRLRAASLADRDYQQLAARVIQLCRQYGAAVVLDRSADMVRQLGADGLHLSARAVAQIHKRPLPAHYWVAASCHDAVELQRAQQRSVDFVVLSPVRRSHGHPGRLGWRQFSRWVSDVQVPVYALGGLDMGDLGTAKAHGAQGIAAIRGLWRS